MATDVATGVASSMLSEIGKLLISTTGRQIGYLINFNYNIENLKKQAEKLKLKRADISVDVDNAKDNGHTILGVVDSWLGSVDKIWEEAKSFLEKDIIENKGCLYGWCPNVKARYSLSRRAKKMTQEVTDLQNQGDRFEKISVRGRSMGIEFTSTGNFHSFPSRKRITQEVKDIVKGGDFQMIGICGLGGVGKTTLMKEVGKWAPEEKLFDEIVMAVVSQNSDLLKIQNELADKLGLTFTETALRGRADRLWDRLLQDKGRNLIILDDVWECIDFKDIGIPVGDDNKKNTIVLTSRSEDVCTAMGCDKIIKVDVLSEEEAWILFREMAGVTTVDAPDFNETASKVAKECRGLPIAIVTVGSALKGKPVAVWNDALRKLSKSKVPTNLLGVEAKVFKSLKFSYDQVNGEVKEAGSIFLLCCLYLEDANIPLEELVRDGMGRKLFEDIELVTEARERVDALIEKLRKCFLLLDGDKPRTVKMHDVVRDVGIWIASENENFKMKVINGGGWPDAAYEHFNAISVQSSQITELPLEGLNCPKLEVLRMSCDRLSMEKLNARNMLEGMKMLRVLKMSWMPITSLPSSLRLLTNLRVLNLEYCSSLTDVSSIPEELVNLEILSLRGCRFIEIIPREMGRLANLRVLDMRGCYYVESVLPGVISSMCRLEELYTETWPWDEEGNASLNEVASLTVLMTEIRYPKFLPKDLVFEKLKRYYIKLCEVDMSRKYFKLEMFLRNLFEKLTDYPFLEKALVLCLDDSTEATIGYFTGIHKMLKESAERVFLKGDGLVIALDELAPGGFRHLKELWIVDCDNEVVEYLANYSSTANLEEDTFGVFTKLEKLNLYNMSHLKAIVSCCHDGKPGGGYFGNLKEIRLIELPELTHLWKYGPESGAIKLSSLQCVQLTDCKGLKYIFTLSEAASLEQLKTLDIFNCEKVEAVILENIGPSSSATTIGDGVEMEASNSNVIKFPKLEVLKLSYLDSLTCFGSVIEFPQLKELRLWKLRKHDCLASIFNHKQVMFPSLEDLTLSGMESKELWGSQYPPSFFPKLKTLEVDSFSNIVNIIPSNSAQYFSGLMRLEVSYCHRLKNICSSSVARNLRNLNTLSIIDCESMEEVIAKEEGVEEDGRIYETIFPQLRTLTLSLPRGKRFFPVNSTMKLPDGFEIDE